LKNIVIGNSIASIALIDKLKNKSEIHWIKDGDSPSGIWRGFEYKNRIIDTAMINFEFDLFQSYSQNSVEEYNQFNINDCGRFVDKVEKYILDKINIKQLPEIMIYSDEGIIQDFLISNNLIDFKRHVRVSQSTKNFETRKMKLHPKFKYNTSLTDDFLAMTLDDYASDAYGEKIRNCIYERWGTRVVGDSYFKIPMLRHRSIWLPLYYPETLSKSLHPEQSLVPTKFYYPKTGTVSEFINSLFLEHNIAKDIEKSELKVYENEIRKVIKKGEEQVVWGSSMPRFLKLMGLNKDGFGIGERGHIDVAYYECEISETVGFTYVLLNLSGTDNSWYRMTIMPNLSFEKSKKVVAIERKSSTTESNFEPLLIKLGFYNLTRIKIVSNLPAFLIVGENDNRILHESYKEIIAEYPNVKFIGNAAYSFASSFNDQVVQALSTVTLLGKENRYV
jgi:hypothetical protein